MRVKCVSFIVLFLSTMIHQVAMAYTQAEAQARGADSLIVIDYAESYYYSLNNNYDEQHQRLLQWQDWLDENWDLLDEADQLYLWSRVYSAGVDLDNAYGYRDDGEDLLYFWYPTDAWGGAVYWQQKGDISFGMADWDWAYAHYTGALGKADFSGMSFSDANEEVDDAKSQLDLADEYLTL